MTTAKKPTRRPPAPRSLRAFREHPLVEMVSNERNGPNDPGDGIWIYLVRGYCWGEVHCIHEDTVAELREAWKDLTPCECGGCHDNGAPYQSAMPAPWPSR